MKVDFFCQITMAPIYPLWIRKKYCENGMALRKKIPIFFSVESQRPLSSYPFHWFHELFFGRFKISILILTLEKIVSFLFENILPMYTSRITSNHQFICTKPRIFF